MAWQGDAGRTELSDPRDGGKPQGRAFELDLPVDVVGRNRQQRREVFDIA